MLSLSLANDRPRWWWIDPGMPWCGQVFDFIACFSRHTLFAATWLHNRPAGQWGRFRVYRRQN
jgi:hypothetical protein